MRDAELYGGLIRLHILHHASEEPVFGLGIIEELRRHGYNLSAGTLYPMLHSMEKAGYLRSVAKQVNGKMRRNYSITPKGKAVLSAGKDKVRELFGELFEDE
jgi:PadR family transcriptional regulator, regulatory protein PadR